MVSASTDPTTATLEDSQLQSLYSWVDEIPLSRPKRNIARDFADAVLAAEVVSYYFPRLVDLHNYPAANSMQQKLYNWDTLNVRVLRKINAAATRGEIESICQCVPGAIEKFLHSLQIRMARYKAEQHQQKPPPPPPVDPTHASSSKQRPSLREPRRFQGRDAMQAEVDQELLIEKEREVQDLRETIDILEQKVSKLEQLIHLKDAKILKLKDQLHAVRDHSVAGLSARGP